MTQKMEGKQLRRLSPSEEWGCGGGGGGLGDGVKGGREGRVVGGGGGVHGRPLGASSRGPTSRLINPIKSRESMGAPQEEGNLSSSSSLRFPLSTTAQQEVS